MEEKINAALEDVKQVLRRDGGDIELVGITDDNIVQVRLQGHRSEERRVGKTLKGIVEQILQEAVPEVKGVEAVD